MKHPETEQWMAFLYGEATPEQRADLEAHLAGCPKCADQLARWRNTMGALDSVEVPARPPVRSSAWRWARGAVAAALLLGGGFALGRHGTISPADLETSINRWGVLWASQMATERAAELQQAVVATVEASRAENQALLDRVLREYQKLHAEDQRALALAMQSFAQEQGVEQARLREALARLALSTGNGFEAARSQMQMLTSYLPPTDTDADATPLSERDPNTPNPHN